MLCVRGGANEAEINRVVARADADRRLALALDAVGLVGAVDLGGAGKPGLRAALPRLTELNAGDELLAERERDPGASLRTRVLGRAS